jgi:histidinol dehydrogenase
MNVYRLNEMSKEKKEYILKRAELDITEQIKLALEVSDDIRVNGDNAIIKYTEKFDKIKIKKEDLKISERQIEEGYDRIDDELKEAIKYAAGNIKSFHEKQMPEEIWLTNIDKGILAGEKVTPIVDVCLYVPGGKGSFPSVLLMLGLPALVAGVERIIVVTPPNKSGKVDDAILAAAKIAGIKEIYAVGGIQAVAAVAFGTETIPKCNKIVGPGNSYVTAAKRVLNSYIDVGVPAGPSEAIILADEYADPEKVALDLMIEAEHGPDSAALLVTHSEELANKVIPLVKEKMNNISQRRRDFMNTGFSTYGGIIITESLQQSIDFINQYAPEHMEIMTKNPFDILPEIKNAGEILLGEYTPITLCNFLMGPNAILPTGGFAKTYSSVSVFDFLKRSSIGYVSKEGFENIRDKAYTFAIAEGFDTHALAVKERK